VRQVHRLDSRIWPHVWQRLPPADWSIRETPALSGGRRDQHIRADRAAARIHARYASTTAANIVANAPLVRLSIVALQFLVPDRRNAKSAVLIVAEILSEVSLLA
jgi:hypothetical protein